jgi:hypothetical protein
LVWPSNGQYLILFPIQFPDKVTGKLVKSFKHFAYQTIEEAATAALSFANDRDNPVDVFFALGSVKEDLTRMRKDDREALGKKVRGVHKTGHDNTCEIKAFWLDLDVKPDPTAYATQQEAATALREFCQAMGLPKPLVTSSGGGFHAYWPLTEALDPDKWQHYASVLKQLTDSWGLRADASRTADRASVLRPVGTHNWKTGNARTVQVVMDSRPVDTNQFLARLAYLVETMQLPPVQQPRHQMILPAGAPLAGAPLAAAVNVAAMNEAAAAGAGYEQADPREVVTKCQQLAWQAGNQANVPEPLWYAMIGCLRHAKDGAKAVHFMSRQSPSYDVFVTDLKVQQHADGGFPPTLCATFEQHRPGGCDGCPFKGKIKTPLQVTRKLEQVAPPTVQLATTTGPVAIALPPPPAPFKRVVNPMTGTARIAMTIGDKAGIEEDIVLYEYDLYPSRLIFDERENRYNVVVHRWLPKDGWKEFDIPTGKLYDRKQLATLLGDIGVLPDLGHVEDLVQYMIGYIRDLQKIAAASTIYAQLGWRPEMDRFILPDRVITPTGVEPLSVSRNITNALSWQDPRGSLDVWKHVVATYERPGMEAHQFGFGVGFASPLFAFTNFGGMLVSMIGERGAGKSSSAMSANSIYGHPKMGWADRENDTARAFVQKLGVLNNLPATYDEHTNLDGDMVSDLCYMVSKGQGRQRLQQNGEAAQNHGNWQLMMLMTGNRSLNARLATAKADSSAESARVFEYTVPANTLTKAEADQFWGPGGLIFENFGVAGEPYIRHVMLNQEWAKERVKHWVREVDTAARVSSGERFWSAGVACVLTGFELANQCGLTNADVGRLFQFAIRVIHNMRADVEENTRSPIGMVSEYINSNMRSMIVLTSDANGAGLAQVQNAPTSDRLRIRLERHTGRLFIDRADFRRFCAKAQMDANIVQRELLNSGVLKAKDIRIVLGRDTIYRTAQTICWLLDANAPALAGVGDVAAVPQQPQVQPAQATTP